MLAVNRMEHFENSRGMTSHRNKMRRQKATEVSISQGDYCSLRLIWFWYRAVVMIMTVCSCYWLQVWKITKTNLRGVCLEGDGPRLRCDAVHTGTLLLEHSVPVLSCHNHMLDILACHVYWQYLKYQYVVHKEDRGVRCKLWSADNTSGLRVKSFFILRIRNATALCQIADICNLTEPLVNVYIICR